MSDTETFVYTEASTDKFAKKLRSQTGKPVTLILPSGVEIHAVFNSYIRVEPRVERGESQCGRIMLNFEGNHKYEIKFEDSTQVTLITYEQPNRLKDLLEQ